MKIRGFLSSQVPTESVRAVSFSFFTDEEASKQSVVKITKPDLVDELGTPVQGGLYDPAMGPLDDRSHTCCRTCGQNAYNCQGHFGHIDIVLPVYNPLLFNHLYKLLQRTCFNCCCFRTSREQVQKCVSQLELVMRGDVVAAKRLDSDSSNHHSYLKEGGEGNDSERDRHSKPERWTSLQFTEAMSILNCSLETQQTCKNCGHKNPKITKPTFGWFERSGAENARKNVIRKCKLVGPLTVQEEGESCGNDVDAGISDISCASSFVTQDTATKKSEEQESIVLDQYFKQKEALSGDLTPKKVKEIMSLLWTKEAQLCSYLSDIQRQGVERKGHYMFFLESVLVPPIKFRPPAHSGDSVMEHAQTVSLGEVVRANSYLKDALDKNKVSQIIQCWKRLQDCINLMFDGQGGILEKKAGMFRQKLMGKRVNFACRSVISPDPYLAVNEIGIPPIFALTLTYPERVTPWNVFKLRNAIVNGSEIHPGATHYIDKTSIKLPQKRRERLLLSRKLPSSKGAGTQHGKGSDYENKIVLRHLQDGDIVLVNRQPTLHKPSIMAHIVRVLKGEKTLRMHYANCSTYNADFDGDEMNVHLPQDEISRAEAYNLVNANNQYVKPTSGVPIRALIQDHIISSLFLSEKDTFFDLDEMNQLLYSSSVSACGSETFSGKPGQKVLMSNSEDAMQLPLPAIWKPVRKWPGKQIITTLLNRITSGSPPLTFEKEAKLPSGFFNCKTPVEEERSAKGHRAKEKQSRIKEAGKDDSREKEEPDESKLLIYKNNLVRGVIDKNQFGDYGLVHNVQELYGSEAAGKLLSAFSRLYTVYLQMHGFTCGVDDLLLLQSKDKKMKEQLESCEELGEKVIREFIGVRQNERKGALILQSDIEEFLRNNGESVSEMLDRKMTSELNKKISNSDVFKQLFQKGLSKPSVKNCMYLMTSSGAKGGVANLQQIAAYLGQQELEGKRVPQMVSGKTLPCFPPWDWSPRAGGFIIDRFLTGLHPQEYYFHCMAGREGLVDTAVKTSRSGYLQRCLIKNLECLKVSYDYTVRDADGSIIQFRYGEDGIDVHLTSFVQKFEKLANNKEMFDKRFGREIDKFNPYIDELPPALKRKAEMSGPDFSLKEKNANLKLMEHKFLSSLAQPGEPVGILAAQSVGEPSTQMTLNTFHNAGRSEMNVTLGIPRLQEILMTASIDIKTPVMTCPLRMGKAEDAKSLAVRLKRITVADIIESMKVNIKPFTHQDHQTCRVYELEMTFFIPEHLSKFSEDWEELLKVKFVRALEDAIQNHLVLLSKISGIKDIKADSLPKASNETDEDISCNISQHEEEGGDDDNLDDSGEGAEDFGLDAQKRKRQGTDEMEYDDDWEDELNEGHHSDGFDNEIDNGEIDVEIDKDGVTGISDANDKMQESRSTGGISKPHSKGKKTKSRDKIKKKTSAKLVRKEYDRATFVSAKGFHFEIHFKFTNEPHILLDQIARKTARNVYVKSSGNILDCQDIDIYGNEDQVFCCWNDPRNKLSGEKNPSEEEKKMRALQTAGVDFATLWKLQDVLDVNYICSNNIHAMLNTYGVEAARETIIKEISNVFKVYGISVNIRHLSLIADYMTHSGGYRPMNRFGGIAESTSPMNKMSFETASKFIQEAAYHGEKDDLETPSARTCLGLPVKVGTGCFDLMHKMEI
uniref:DNA-directed RNA polymerase I subunit RPA1-like isoform X1 n=1 Tax=Fragaria vesca subsp. vesca TaxID=101020 RepID=UPI0005C81059|nr:PREDICTED: DNA-directed RNA polymerase I subunit RPA1-like isoform X1 [Fragaria vesca subsp. vesca]